MKPLTIQGIVLVVMILALPLASLGTTTDATWASVTALGMVGVASLVPPVMRFVGPQADDDDEQDADHEGDQDGDQGAAADENR